MKKYEKYIELVDKMHNPYQKYLCYENAFFYCEKNSQLKAKCQEKMEQLINKNGISVSKIAIVIVSYNNADLMKNCIESIRKNCLSFTYHLIVVDNASSDGIVTWLRKQGDITLIENDQNMGFPYACNQGIAMAEADEDIFLLNNDTIVPPDALFWLRIGLYEKNIIGAVGSVSNSVANYQQVDVQYDSIEEWMDFAESTNVYMEYPYEKKSWLVGFAMLIKRTALEDVLRSEKKENMLLPEVLDTRFSPGNFEDNDLSIRLLLSGYELLLCKNSFIFHHGGKSFGKNPKKYIELLLKNQKKLEEKYGIDFVQYSQIESSIVDMIYETVEKKFRVLEIDCKLGATLARIQSLYPNAEVIGIEERLSLSILAKQVVRLSTLEQCKEESFDYIILDHILERKESPMLLLKTAEYLLKKEGVLLVAIRNSQCVRKPQTGLSLDEIVQLFDVSGFQLKKCSFRALCCNSEEQRQLIDIMEKVEPLKRPLYEAESYIFEALKI